MAAIICQHKHKADCNTTEYNMVRYVEQNREAQKCSYLSTKPYIHRKAQPYTGFAKKRGHRLMTIILSILNRFKHFFQ